MADQTGSFCTSALCLTAANPPGSLADATATKTARLATRQKWQAPPPLSPTVHLQKDPLASKRSTGFKKIHWLQKDPLASKRSTGKTAPPSQGRSRQTHSQSGRHWRRSNLRRGPRGSSGELTDRTPRTPTLHRKTTLRSLRTQICAITSWCATSGRNRAAPRRSCPFRR